MATRKGNGRLPDFMIVGAAKSGTSTVFNYLRSHPQVFMPDIKEPEFFSRKAIYDKGLDWYKMLFTSAKIGQLCGDASTTYTRWPHTIDSPALIAEVLPDTKFIYIMRHPIDRAYSHYGHHMRMGVTMTFEEALEKDDIYLDCSRYMFQIQRYIKFFNRGQFLFLFLDDLKRNPAKLLASILDFLELKQMDLTTEAAIKTNVGGVDHYIRHRTTQRLRGFPPIGFIADYMPKWVKDFVFNMIKASFPGKRLAKEGELKSMLPETRSRLIDFFENDNRELEAFLGVKLDSWRI